MSKPKNDKITIIHGEVLQSKNKLIFARAGEVWVINDKKTRGHKSIITSNNKKDRKKGIVKHIPITHAQKTNGVKNLKLQENPEKEIDNKNSYVLKKMQKSKNTANAHKKENLQIKNPIDKSIRRHIQKNK